MQQQGLATLWASTLLLLLTGLWGWLALQAVKAESTRGSQQMHAAQALANSEAILETAIAHLTQAYALNGISADAQVWENASASSCPADKSPPQWQCTQWSFSHQSMPEWTHTDKSFVRLVRDVRNSPHRIQVSVDATLNALHPGEGSRATVQQSLYIPISTSLRDNTHTGHMTRLVLNDQVLTTHAPSCNLQAWQTVFGQLSPLQVQHLSKLQASNGLNSATSPTRRVYWIDSPQLWNQSLGNPTSPVVLVFSETACALQCPSMTSQTQVVGIVFFQNQCQAHTMQNWQGGTITGQIGVESSLSTELSMTLGNGLQNFNNAHGAINFDWPADIDTSRVQRIAGTWKNAGH